MRRHTAIESPVGVLTAVADDDGLCGLFMEGAAHRPPSADFGERADVGFEHLRTELDEYFSGERQDFTVTVSAVGTPFRRRVWALLRAIPYGQTRTYGDLARDLGDPGAVRAVGGANARNPVCIVVPCHRVVGADGSLTGFAGGVERKLRLLALEDPTRATATLF
ncbi:methylated-DNA--[protein]-cysteine S-methyltransferase [Sanguibacter suaedae]|uniref:Methylated-DNA--protein-cysteine methyltransferase n=1 Tax=Sanguibacter suaedae TaxID=2795737 RepID=A0A934ICC0_9MICO|nr:methylated-DNA--[protein]-cysteine S-methyltransferase [Sanguibacter suaedae]MBI9116060.1 methylated-DNA--[protein]-cysteine S-methyltransferase [Sanguibacter suaedae]